jgi:apolipoprotein N-acyltransferase
VLATLFKRTGWTWYVRYGDLPVLLLAAVAGLGGWYLARRSSTLDGNRSTIRAG